jgi:hypothetical protein
MSHAVLALLDDGSVLGRLVPASFFEWNAASGER